MIKITVQKPDLTVKKILNISITLNGDYMLREHPEIDIVVMPKKCKILILPKTDYSDRVYAIQSELTRYLVDKGVVLPDGITGGNVYGSLQAFYPQEPPNKEDPTQVVIYTISNFIDEQRPKYSFEKEYQDEMEKRLTNPSVEDSTELGEIPEEEFKGSIPKWGYMSSRTPYRYHY